MSEIDIIKEQIKKIQDLKYKNNPVISEHIKEIKNKYLITETDDGPKDPKRYNVAKSVSDEIEDNIENEEMPNEKSQA